MHFWVSEWNTLTNDPYRVMLVQDTLWARGPLRDQPEPVAQLLVAVAPPNEAEPIAAQDRDRFPLPAGYYGAPLDGPEESSSNLAGNEPQHSKDGLTRRQEAIGVPGSCVYNATKQAATVAEAAREVAEEAAERERGTAASLRNQIDELRREVDAARVHATAERTASAAAEAARDAAQEAAARERAAAQEAAERERAAAAEARQQLDQAHAAATAAPTKSPPPASKSRRPRKA